MLLVGSENAGVGFADGMRVLRAGGRALDAVEAAIRRVESNPADHSLGHARVTRWRWPPESVKPRSPTTASNLAANCSTSSATPAATAAVWSSSRPTPSRPRVMLSAMEREKRKPSCGT